MSKEAIANLRVRFENARSRSREVDTATFYLAADALTALDGWEAALATGAEERGAWDAYAAAAMDIIGGTHRNEFAATAAKVADEMLAERRKRFGGGT